MKYSVVFIALSLFSLYTAVIFESTDHCIISVFGIAVGAVLYYMEDL